VREDRDGKGSARQNACSLAPHRRASRFCRARASIPCGAAAGTRRTVAQGQKKTDRKPHDPAGLESGWEDNPTFLKNLPMPARNSPKCFSTTPEPVFWKLQHR
jgi:hypothetical protein